MLHIPTIEITPDAVIVDAWHFPETSKGDCPEVTMAEGTDAGSNCACNCCDPTIMKVLDQRFIERIERRANASSRASDQSDFIAFQGQTAFLNGLEKMGVRESQAMQEMRAGSGMGRDLMALQAGSGAGLGVGGAGRAGAPIPVPAA